MDLVLYDNNLRHKRVKWDIQFIEVQYHASQRRSQRIFFRMRRQPYGTSERYLYRIIQNQVVVEQATL